MIIIFMGPPGSGKGTQARRAAEACGLPHLSMGDMLRAALSAGEPIADHVRASMSDGGLVADQTIRNVLLERTRGSDCKSGFILDGFPRTLPQTHMLDSLVAERGEKIMAIELEVDASALERRILGRLNCADCGEIHGGSGATSDIPKCCRNCGSDRLKRRSDDNSETLRVRIASYMQETKPVANHYAQQGLLTKIDGELEVEDIATQIQALLAV